MRNPHAGEPFRDDDAAIAKALDDVAVPALLCSLVHMTGDVSWIRRHPTRTVPSATDYQCGLTADEQADIRRQAVPVIAAYRDAGCEPVELDDATLAEMMAFLATRPVEGRLAGMFFEDMQFGGGDSRVITWGDEIPAAIKAASPVVVIGCGESGILAGIRLTQAGLPFTIIDKNAGPGGTWWENRYPGARVDVGSHQYCYSFEPSHHWSQYYCEQPELRAYFERVVDKYELASHCRFDTAVTSVMWDDGAALWHVTVQRLDGSVETIDARFVISAVGSLNLPHVPDIPGMDTFAGRSFHSARWPDDIDIDGKDFALIGAGASGFQIAPTIAEQVGRLTIYQRTAQWISYNPIYRSKVPSGDHWALQHLPFYTRWFRFMMTYPGIAFGTSTFVRDPDYDDSDGLAINSANAERRVMQETWLRAQLEGHPDLTEKSLPDYPAGGKRPLQDDGSWLRSLMRPDVELVRTGIERIVPDGVITVDGIHRHADVICFATGFRHNDFLAPMTVTGRDGTSLRDQWGDEPTAYLGVTMPNFPNLFCLYGPGTNLAHSSSLFFHSEFQTTHALDVIRFTLTHDREVAEVKQAVHDHYAEWHQAEVSQLIWAHPAVKHSHYKNPAGKVYTLSPWPIDQYWELTLHVDPDAYELR